MIFELLNFEISAIYILIFFISYISEGFCVYFVQLFELVFIMQYSSAKLKPKLIS